jgi:Na+/phosphate symporter
MVTTLPLVTADALRAAVLDMCAKAAEMLGLTRHAFLEPRPPTFDQVAALGKELHLREKRLTDRVAMQLRDLPWSLGPAAHLTFAPAALERIGDSIEALARCIRSIHQEGIPLSERGCAEVLKLFSQAELLVREMATAIRTEDRLVLSRVRETGLAFEAFCDDTAIQHQDRLLQGHCAPRASSFFFALLDYFREIERYIRRMAETVEKSVASA